MDEIQKKNEIVKAMTAGEFYPDIIEEEVVTEEHLKIPFSQISAMGTAFEPLAAAFQKVMNGGKAISGIYRVTVPPGGELAHFRQEDAFLGTVLNGNHQISAQARLNPLVCDPTALFMAAALMSINKKLDSIQEAQREILEFLEQKEKAKTRGNLNFLADVLNNYKHNWANEKYKNSNHIKVLDIRQEAEQSILFYREQIDKKTKKQSLIHMDKDVKDKLKKIQSEFKEYQLALYLYAFSSFLEVLLLENFESVYLDGISKKIEDYAFQYREMYTACYNQIEKYSKSSVQSHLLSGLASINKVAGNAVAKIPVVSKSQIDETLIEASSRLGNFSSKRTEQTMEHLINRQSSAVHIFIGNINMLNRLYNQSMDLLFDKENIYFSVTNQ